ncbi:alpha/beta hydrolase family protein [Actinoplanes octamycinicus]|nr:alpha/beta hydrolase family protein [Actinoplanes octamycinicus]
MQWLRVTQETDHWHLVAMGHSYGSTIVGGAAKSHQLPVDDIVVAGSPGGFLGATCRPSSQADRSNTDNCTPATARARPSGENAGPVGRRVGCCFVVSRQPLYSLQPESQTVAVCGNVSRIWADGACRLSSVATS